MKRSERRVTDDDQTHEDFSTKASNLKGDYTNVVILLFLYLLQGEFINEKIISFKIFFSQEFHLEYRALYRSSYKTEAFPTQSRLGLLLRFIHSRVSVIFALSHL